MSFDIELVNRQTREVMFLKHPRKVYSGTVPVLMEDGQPVYTANGQFAYAEQKEASINITYNYSRYYSEAAQNDARFAYSSLEMNYGIRGLNGKTVAESIPMLTDMVQRITKKYMNENNDWVITHRTKVIWFDALGNETHCLSQMDHNEIKEYDISEGDTSSYWEPTAANAIRPLRDMLYMAIDNLLEDAVWEVE